MPQKEFNSILLDPRPVKIDVATEVVISTNSEWAMLLPLNDSSMQSFCTLSVNKVVSPMPKHQLKHLLEDVKADNTKVKTLQELRGISHKVISDTQIKLDKDIIDLVGYPLQ